MLLDWIKLHQALLGALIGFAGLIIAALFNAHLNRRRDDRILAKQTQAFARAIAVEIETLGNAAETRAELAERYLGKYFDFGAKEHFRTMALPTAKLLSQMPNDVGNLPTELVEQTVRFAVYVAEMQLHLERFIARYTDLGPSNEKALMSLVKGFERIHELAKETGPALKRFSQGL